MIVTRVYIVVLASCLAAWQDAAGRPAHCEADPAHVTLAWEAEDFSAIYPYLRTVDCEGASGGRCLSGPEPRSMRDPTRAVYRVDVPRSGTYYLWARLQAGSGDWGTWETVRVNGRKVGYLDYPRFLPPRPVTTATGEPVQFFRGENGRWVSPWCWTPCLTIRTFREVPKDARLAPVPLDLAKGMHVLEVGPPGGSQIESWDQLDMLLLTTDADRDLLLKTEAVPCTGERVVFPQTEPSDLLVVKAESASSLELPCEPRAARGASGGSALGWRDEDWGGRATYVFNLPSAGTYYLWARMSPMSWVDLISIPSGGWVAEAGGSEATLSYSPSSWGWTWVRPWMILEEEKADRGKRVPRGLELPAGRARLALRPGKPRAGMRMLVDQLALTKDRYYVPARTGWEVLEVRGPQPIPGG
ncbi:MAG: hypothetical protein GW880_17290 [Armatimonadetes bacterium]|nr:hypothetical protein [Armatimonadota bacterium]NCP31233.1 hypothetical protein [Armatimonadota bacterium]